MTPEEQLAKLLWEARHPRTNWEGMIEMSNRPASMRYSSINSAQELLDEYRLMARTAIADGWHQ